MTRLQQIRVQFRKLALQLHRHITAKDTSNVSIDKSLPEDSPSFPFPTEIALDTDFAVDEPPSALPVELPEEDAAVAVGDSVVLVGPDRTIPEALFLSDSYRSDLGQKEFKLYIPGSYVTRNKEDASLLVMLHGCNQSPDDFSVGTQMNKLADRHGFLVLYPAQSIGANSSKCWNWFRWKDQIRGSGEPAFIVAMTQKVIAEYGVNPRRVYVAGLSAGAAMAVILGKVYPDVYAGVGAHSGVSYGAAHGAASAYGAMRAISMYRRPSNRFSAKTSALHQRVPTIAFHGDQDHTVNAKNSKTIVEQAFGESLDNSRLTSTIESGEINGRSYTRTTYSDAPGEILIEHWLIVGAGHAWSGGNENGSYASATGPNASQEIVRFFLSLHPRPTGGIESSRELHGN